MSDNFILLRPRRESTYLGFDYGTFVTGRDGFVYPERNDGLFMHRTRMLSRYRYLADGKQFEPVTQSLLNHRRWFGYYIQGAPRIDGVQDTNSTIETLELTVAREFNADGLCEQLELTNYSQNVCKFEFGIEVEADFSDQDEVQSGRRLQHGEIKRHFSQTEADLWKLTYDYLATHNDELSLANEMADFHRRFEMRIEVIKGEMRYYDGEMTDCDGVVRCNVVLDCLETMRLGLRFQQISGNRVAKGPFSSPAVYGGHVSFKAESPTCSANVQVPSLKLDEANASKTISQASRDLDGLRMYCLDQNGGWVPAAGWPEYLAFFGRDVLIAGMESAMRGTQMLRGALSHLARWQTDRTYDWRDEQPGRMLHQAEIGPLAVLNFTPLGLYYGTITTPALFPWALGQLWKWTADRNALASWIEPALKALGWLDRYCLSGRTGFYEYSTHSLKGIKNQGWKDSAEAIVYEDGSKVKNPIAICECQGYVYRSKLESAEMLDFLGRQDEAQVLKTQAADLKRRFNECFWMPEIGFFAMGLDKEGRKIRSIGSNPLHCINAGIIDDSLVVPTVERLFEPDLYSGWGVRTLSSCHPAFNPHSYQRGSVWPFEHGSLSLGLARYGLYKQLERVVHDQFDAAALFERNSLPELFSGHHRNDKYPFPSIYPQANWPQAWSASSIFAHLEALLGLQPDAPNKRLVIDANLPLWLPDLELAGLRVGDTVVDIGFERRADGKTDFKVTKMFGSLEIIDAAKTRGR